MKTTKSRKKQQTRGTHETNLEDCRPNLCTSPLSDLAENKEGTLTFPHNTRVSGEGEMMNFPVKRHRIGQKGTNEGYA